MNRLRNDIREISFGEVHRVSNLWSCELLSNFVLVPIVVMHLWVSFGGDGRLESRLNSRVPELSGRKLKVGKVTSCGSELLIGDEVIRQNPVALDGLLFCCYKLAR